MENKETCEYRVEKARDSRINDIRTMLEPDVSQAILTANNGRYFLEIGDLSIELDEPLPDESIDGAFEEHEDGIREVLREQFYEYGLSFDWKEGGEDESGYYQYCISTGGPHEEFRFYVDRYNHCYRVDFWLLDWYDGAGRTLHGADKDLLLRVLEAMGDEDE